MDLVSPDLDKYAARYNMMSKVRDDSHINARTQHELLGLVKQAGLTDATVVRKEVYAIIFVLGILFGRVYGLRMLIFCNNVRTLP